MYTWSHLQGPNNSRVKGKCLDFTSIYSRKSLYGLNQSPQLGLRDSRELMLKNGYRQCLAKLLFLKLQNDKVQAFIVYVNDIVVIGNDQCEMGHLKNFLGSEIEIKDSGQIQYFLGIEVVLFSYHKINMYLIY